jgi:hypothetical protein
MRGCKLSALFAFAVRGPFEDTGIRNPRQNPGSASHSRSSAKPSIPDVQRGGETGLMLDDCYSVPPKHERRLQAVLALFRGEAVETVTTQYRIGRSDLYKFRARALVAMRVALRDQPRSPKRPHNRLAPGMPTAGARFPKSADHSAGPRAPGHRAGPQTSAACRASPSGIPGDQSARRATDPGKMAPRPGAHRLGFTKRRTPDHQPVHGQAAQAHHPRGAVSTPAASGMALL